MNKASTADAPHMEERTREGEVEKNAKARLYEVLKFLVKRASLIPKAMGSQYRVSWKEWHIREHVMGGIITMRILSDCLGLNHSSAPYKLHNFGQDT